MLAHRTPEPTQPPFSALLWIGIRRFAHPLEHAFHVALEQLRAAALGGAAALVSSRLCRKILVGKADDVQTRRKRATR